jgi:biotin synthase
VVGTPLGQQAALDPLVFVRTIATARILMPASMVRLSAGRRSLSREAVALCFVAGANSLFIGEKLLTTPNPEPEDDMAMLGALGLEPLPLR